MKRTNKLLLITITALLCALSALAQTVTPNVNYQGYLTAPGGGPLYVVATNVDLEFRIFDESQSGNQLWAEKQTVTVINGNFSTLLGAGNVIAGEDRDDLDTVFQPVAGASDFRYLEVTLKEDGAIPERVFLPRQRMVTTPFAFRAKVAESVVDDAISSSQIALNTITAGDIGTGAINSDEIFNNSITVDDIGTGAVRSDEIFDNSITFNDIGSGAVRTDEIFDNTITVDDIGSGAVRSDEIFNNSITSSDIGEDAVGSSELGPKVVSTGHIADNYGLLNRSGSNYGVGKASPEARLHVGSPAGPRFRGTVSIFDTQKVGVIAGLPTAVNISYSIRSDGSILSPGFHATSDARIKQVTGLSSTEEDLQTLMGIEITDYTLLENPQAKHKKVIAQQVESVLPQVVSKTVGVIGDIYKMAPVQGEWVQLETTLKVGDRVRLIDGVSEAEYPVLAVEPTRFRVAYAGDSPKVFVFGRQVDDFRSVDYQAISMLNVSATQQLKKNADALQAENADLRKRLAALETLTQQLVKAVPNARPALAAPAPVVKPVSLIAR